MKGCFFILGFGYTAEFLVKELIEFDLQVIGTTRSREKIGFYPHSNYELVNFSAFNIEKYLKRATHILISNKGNTYHKIFLRAFSKAFLWKRVL